jgi:hypothetical protein
MGLRIIACEGMNQRQLVKIMNKTAIIVSGLLLGCQ